MLKLLQTFAPAEVGTATNGHDKKPYRGKPKKVRAKPAKTAKAKGKTKAKARVVDPAKLDEFGLRKGSLRSKAAALYASKRGATLAEVKNKLDSIQFNVLAQLRDAGYKVKESKEAGDGTRQITRYHLSK